jgi:N-succinyldiaminopimelate aminotransferase
VNPDLDKLHPYPFEKLRALFAELTPPADKRAIALSIGEPQHSAPQFVLDALTRELPRLANYPATAGISELRQAIAAWLQRRFDASVDADAQVLPVNGTREALFAIAQACISRSADATVLSPNPFYQIYEGAALLAGAQVGLINCTAASDFLPDFSRVTEQQWQQCQLLYLCSPGNPTGATLSLTQLQELIALAREHNFIIASDECYSEIYPVDGEPPAGLLQACAAQGDSDYRNCLVFHSLSKRSNLPGLRSGFVAGDASLIKQFLRYRTYHGCAMPPHHQWASIAAWSDEQHVVDNRLAYDAKFDAVLSILSGVLPVARPPAGFYLWPETPVADTELARQLYRDQHLTVLPGSFLARETTDGNPGANRLRLALVASVADCVEASERLRAQLERL